MEILEKIRKRLKNPLKTKTKETEIPSKWLKGKERIPRTALETPTVIIRREGPRKIRIPGLRIAKRLVAFVLGVFHFFVAQVTLTGASATHLFAIPFLLTSFLLFDYVWKTRKERAIFERVMK